jgi:hypothetical protein
MSDKNILKIFIGEMRKANFIAKMDQLLSMKMGPKSGG